MVEGIGRGTGTGAQFFATPCVALACVYDGLAPSVASGIVALTRTLHVCPPLVSRLIRCSADRRAQIPEEPHGKHSVEGSEQTGT